MLTKQTSGHNNDIQQHELMGAKGKNNQILDKI